MLYRVVAYWFAVTLGSSVTLSLCLVPHARHKRCLGVVVALCHRAAGCFVSQSSRDGCSGRWRQGGLLLAIVAVMAVTMGRAASG